MCRFIETIQLKDGKFLNLDLHQQRINRTHSAFFPKSAPFQLNKVLAHKDLPGYGRFKCTLHYAKHPADFIVKPYSPRNIKQLKICKVNDLDYSWKYARRSVFNALLSKLEENEEIIIVKKDFVTDASYANLAFYNGVSWETPSTPLLPGTKRQKLLIEGNIVEKEIRAQDIQKYMKVSLINAMLDLGEVEIRMDNIKESDY